MNVVSIKIKNFLSISDAEIRPGQVTQITGKNGQGKTSVLKALEFAIKGASDGRLVKFGEENAEVIVELSDQTTIRRKVGGDGKQTLDVRRDGFAAPKPQAFLDSLFAEYAFNPLEVLDPKKRTDSILASISLSVTEESLAGELGVDKDRLPPLEYSQHGLKVIDQAHKFYYQRRSEANRDALEKKNRWETYRKDLPEEPAGEVKTRQQVEQELEGVNAELIRADQELQAIRRTHTTAKAAKERVDRYQKTVDEIDVQIAEMKQKLAAIEARRAEGVKFVEEAKREVPKELADDQAAQQKYNDLGLQREQIKAQMTQVEHAETRAKQRALVADLEKEYQTAKAFSESLSEKVEALSGPVKERLMSAVEMPVKGLEYRDGAFLVDGVPVENLSSSAAIRLAIGVARKLSKKTKLICLDGAEQLDEETYKSLRSEIESDGYTYFLTKVGEPFDAPADTVVKMEMGSARV